MRSVLTQFPYSMSISASGYTKRANHLQEEGGALNAGYTPVDALCAISNFLGKHGLEYNKDWWWTGFSTEYPYQQSRPLLDQQSNYMVNINFAKEEHKLLLNLTSNMKQELI